MSYLGEVPLESGWIYLSLFLGGVRDFLQDQGFGKGKVLALEIKVIANILPCFVPFLLSVDKELDNLHVRK